MRRSILEPLSRWTERDPDRLLYAFLDLEGRVTESYTYRQFTQRTTEIASHLRRVFPMKAGERVLLAYPPGVEMICAFFACVRLGLIPVPVYPPAGHGFKAALDKMGFIARDCGAAAVLTTRAYYWSMRVNEARHRVATLSFRRDPVSKLQWIVSTDADRGVRADFTDAPSELLFLQYTSGSTSDPKGVMVTHENVLDNCEAVVDHRPVGVSWLPQYHDMGLLGYYLYFALKGGTTYGFSPMDFIQRPALWLETISTYRGTASSAPNFAYEYCLRPDKISDAALETLDLSSLRFLMTAAEPVRPHVYRAFIQRFERCGLAAESSFVAYGLAENTLAVSNYGRDVVAFDRAALLKNQAQVAAPDAPPEATTTLVSCGRTLGTTQVKIVDVTESPREARAGQVGEIWIRGGSKCQGYWGRPELSAATFEATLPADPEQWLRSGDLGFLHQGELYVCGRRKDLIIVRGLNYHPQDIELIVEADAAIRKGCVAAFAHEEDGREKLIVVAELKEADRPPEAGEINRRLLQGLGIAADRFVFIPARTISKTSSGKISRHRTRDRWVDGELTVLHEVTPAVAPEPSAALAEAAMGTCPADTFERCLRELGLNGSETRTLSEVGLDSLRLVELAHALKRQLEQTGHEDLSRVVDLRVLHRIAICELSELLLQLAAAEPLAKVRFQRTFAELGEEHRALERERMRQDARLPFELAGLPRARATSSGGREAVLLTGATGFFGPFLLSSLLRQSDDDVVVLIRAKDDEDALRRLGEGLRSIAADGQSLPARWERRVRPVCGDLAAGSLGLTQARWRTLAEEVHTIFHNGALVNYLLDYAAMRDANVGGTNEIVRLAASHRTKVLNHISTTFVFGWSVKETLFESDTNPDMEHLDFGYSQSKWVSEQVLRDAMRQGLQARIFRPALLTPSLHGGGYNLDISIRLLAFMLNHGLSTSATNQVSFSPADLAADNIVAISRQPETVGGTFHVTRDEYARMADITALLSSLTGRSFQSHPLDDFVPEVIARCQPGDVLFPLLDFLVRSVDQISAMEFKRYDNRHYRRARDASPFGRGDPPLHDVVLGMLRFMRKHALVKD